MGQEAAVKEGEGVVARREEEGKEGEMRVEEGKAEEGKEREGMVARTVEEGKEGEGVVARTVEKGKEGEGVVARTVEVGRVEEEEEGRRWKPGVEGAGQEALAGRVGTVVEGAVVVGPRKHCWCISETCNPI